MKKRTYSIAKIQTTLATDIAKQILQSENQIKVKGGASPWISTP